MSDDLKVGAAGSASQGAGQVDAASNEQKRSEIEQQQLTEGLSGKKEKSAEQEETLTVTVENGESIAKLAKKYGVSVKEIMDLNEKQIKYFKNAKDCDDTKKYAGFLVGARIKLPANANMKAVEENLKTTVEAERKKYEESMKKLDKELCDDRTQSYRVMDENFRKEHNIRTKSEYEAGNTAPEAPETPTDPKTPKEPVKSEDKELSDEEFREKYPYIARPKEDTQAYEPPKFEPPKFPGAELPKEEEIQVPLRPKDEAETPEAPKTPKAPETPTEKEKPADSKDKYNGVQIPLRPSDDTPAYEPPKFEPPKFPGAELPKEEEIQVPLRPKDEAETPEAPKTPKAPETPAEKEKPADSKDKYNGVQIPLRPSDDTPAYEPPKFEVAQFPGNSTSQKSDSTEVKTEERMPSIQEISDEAKKNREANKPWWKFW